MGYLVTRCMNKNCKSNMMMMNVLEIITFNILLQLHFRFDFNCNFGLFEKARIRLIKPAVLMTNELKFCLCYF